MTVEAGMKVKLDGIDEAESGLDRLDKKLGDVGKTAESTSARIKGYQALWKDPAGAKGGWDWSERMGASIAKASVQVIGKQISAAADAVVAPAKTSYAGAIAVANQYRDTTQRISTATGRNYYEISAQIDSSSKRLGILPERVQAYGRSVRGMTDDWGSAMSGLDAYQNRALKTDRTLEDMIPTAVELTNVFGVKSTEQVSRFFGTIDKQAAAAKVSAQQTERVFMDLAGTLSQVTSADPSKLTAMSAQLLAGAGGNVGRAERRGAGIMGFLDQHGWWFEQQAKHQGVLKKSESFYDDQGLMKDPNKMIEFAQSEARRVSKGKVTGDVVSYLTAIQGMPREVAAGLMNYKTGSAQRLEGMGGAASDVISGFLGTGAGGRMAAEASKSLKDARFGAEFLGAQDSAIDAGGGAAGVALASAGDVFNKAAGIFSDAVNIFANTGKGAVGAAATSAGGAATGTTVANVAARGAIGVAGTVGLAAGALFMEGDKPPEAFTKEQEQADIQRQLKDRQGRGGFSNWFAKNVGREESTESLQQRLAALKGGGSGMDMASADMVGAAIVKHLQGATLRTQSVQQPGAEPGQSQPQ
jgi:hypothetical protein